MEKNTEEASENTRWVIVLNPVVAWNLPSSCNMTLASSPGTEEEPEPSATREELEREYWPFLITKAES